MKASTSILILAQSIFLSIGCKEKTNKIPEAEGQLHEQPNIVLIIADDMGYSDISYYGGEIPTPNIDALFETGTKLEQFYVSTSCSPSRAMLLSGADSHKVGYGSMSESIFPWQKNHPGYEGHLSSDVVTYADILQENGYHTYLTGKWHQGITPDKFPDEFGFEKYYTMLNGSSFHDGKLLPMPEVFRQNIVTTINHVDNGNVVDFSKGDYSTNVYTDKMIGYIDQSLNDSKPFLAHLALTAPHWPLQAPTEYIERFKGKYDKGYQEVAQNRIDNIKKRGVIPDSIQVPIPKMRDWDNLSVEEQKIEAKKMEVYAAMISNMDDNVGKLISFLKEKGIYENTVIFFFADNGADAASIEKMPQPFEFNNEVENMGNPDSFFAIGKDWGEVISLPYRDMKSSGFEGGIRSVSAFKTQYSEKISTISDFLYITDVLPTLLDLANLRQPEILKNQKMSGTSFAPSLIEGKPHSREGFGMELSNLIKIAKAYRYCDHKIVWVPKPLIRGQKPTYGGHWELYNIKEDPIEAMDLSTQNPEKLKELLGLYEQYCNENGVIQAPSTP